MSQPNVICPFKTIQLICVAELLLLILGAVEVTLGQASTPPTKSAIKGLVYQVQTLQAGSYGNYGQTATVNRGSVLTYSLPGGTRPATSEIYGQVALNVDAKQLVQGGRGPSLVSGRGQNRVSQIHKNLY